MEILIQVINESARASSTNSGSWAAFFTWIPNWLRVAATVLTGGLVTYIVRQRVERAKLLRALKSEIRGMSGIESCKNTMSSRGEPSASTEDYLKPKEMPPTESIPTLVFEANVGKIGLLKSKNIQKTIRFYTRVLKYKGTISSIRAGDDLPEVDQNELWREIESLASERVDLFGEDWLDENSTGNSRD